MILRGWKDICKAAGGISVNTARRLAKEEGLPVTFLAGKPTTTDAALITWVEKRCQENSWPFREHQSALERASATWTE